MAPLRAAVLLGVLCAGCGDSSEETTPSKVPVPDAGPSGDCGPGTMPTPAGTCCAAGEAPNEDGTCRDAGTQSNGCLAGEKLEGGACSQAGIPPDGCAAGFVADGAFGCTPVLPADMCEGGQMAVPGDPACRPVAECGVGAWGDIPIDGTTEFVDAAYSGGASDGSMASPWITIQDAVDAAASGALVAIAEGTYAEDVVTGAKAVRLWGRCPELVEIAGVGTFAAVQVLYSGATGTEVHGVAITGPATGLVVSGTKSMTAERIWIHDTGEYGFRVQNDLGPTSAMLVDSLVENATTTGAIAAGATLTIDRTALRTTQPLGSLYGRGAEAQVFGDERAHLVVRGSVIEMNHEAGVFVGGSEATLEGSVVRDTLPRVSDDQAGRGLALEFSEGQRASAAVKGCLFERNRESTLHVAGSDLALETTVVRDTLPLAADDTGGAGLTALPAGGGRPNVQLARSVFERNRVSAVAVAATDGEIDSVVVRDTAPQSSDAFAGRGIAIQGSDTGERSNLIVRSSVVANNVEAGIFVDGSDVAIEATVVAGTKPSATDDIGGYGVDVEYSPETSQRGNVRLVDCRIERNHDGGVHALSSDLVVTSTAVIDTESSGGHPHEGFGIAAVAGMGTTVPSTLVVTSSAVARSQGAGIIVEGGSAKVEATIVTDTLAAPDGMFGRGIVAQHGDAGLPRTTIELRGSVVELSTEVGVSLSGVDATIESTIVRDTRPGASGLNGRGINLQADDATQDRGTAYVRAVVVERCMEMGIFVWNSDLVLEDGAVRETASQTSDGRFGDGLAVFGTIGGASAKVTRTLFEKSARAAISNFNAVVELASSSFECNAIDLDGETLMESFSFHDAGGNVCGCRGASTPCSVLTSSLEAPVPLPLPP